MDFGELPPEINSARIYSGPGSAPLLSAATAWQQLAAELNATAASYSSVISALAGQEWLGASALAMAAAAAPYVAWMRTTAAQAEHVAAQAIAAANAYESVLTMTVPPATIAANRSTMMALIATNILGQNAPAIATSEADYSEMWTQDVVAMESYAGTSAAASELAPFNLPPTTTGASPPTAVAPAAVTPTSLLGAAAAATTSGAVLGLPTPIGDLDLLVLGAVIVAAVSTGVQGAQLVEIYRHDVIDEEKNSRYSYSGDDNPGASGEGNRSTPGTRNAGPGANGGALAAPGVKPPVAALSGYSASIGGLSVPQSWILPPVVRQIAAMLPSAATPMFMTASSDGCYAGMAAAGLAGTSLAGVAARGGSAGTAPTTTPVGGASGTAATRLAANTPAVPAAAAGAGIPGLPSSLPPGVVANLAATLAAIPGATIIVVPPNPNQ